MIPFRRLFTFSAFAALATAAHSQMAVYNNDFSLAANSTNATWSDTTLSTSNGERFLGNTANGSGNGTNTLSLTNLAPHSSVTLSFDVYIINTWDGNGPNGGNSFQNPDSFAVSENANSLLLTSFANFTSGNTQSYSATTPNGLGFSNAPRSGQFDAGHLGYGTADGGDATYRLSYTFADTSSSLALAFTSGQNQGIGDEGWGLDNVRVTIVPTPTPEPASFAALGVGALAILRRRRKA